MEAHLPNRPAPSGVATRRARGVCAAMAAALPLLLGACAQHSSGEYSRVDCSNGLDDDGDRLADCDDPDCSVWVLCSAEFIRLRTFDAGSPDVPDAPLDAGTDAQVPPALDLFALSAAEAMVPVSRGLGLCLDPCTPMVGLECYCLPDPYVQIALGGEVLWTSKVVKDVLNPRWAQDSQPPAMLRLSIEDMGRLTFIVMDADDGALEVGISPATDDLVFQCAPSLEDLGSGYLGCSDPQGTANSWVRVDAVQVAP